VVLVACSREHESLAYEIIDFVESNFGLTS
jgi:hypothetical protein